MPVRLLVWALVVQLLLAGVFVYFAVTGFPFLPDAPPTAQERPACRELATAGRPASEANRLRTRCR
ncbi:MAG: hypothetical protein WBC33_12565 [Conexibacter sp.]